MARLQGQERKTVGATELRISRLGIGGGSQANEGGEMAFDAVLERCWERGLRFFDTAPLYADGESEVRLGRFLQSRVPGEFVLSSKVGRYPSATAQRNFDFSASRTRASIEESLERLGLQRVDIVFIHDVDREMHGENFDAVFEQVLDECYPVLEKLRAEGTIGAIGLSSRQSDVLLKAADVIDVDCFMMAGSYTLLNHGPLAELFPYCERDRKSVVIASPYNSGILATGSPSAPFEYKPAAEDVLRRVQTIVDICTRYEVVLAQAALQFPLFHPAVASVVVGHRHPSEVDRNIEGLEAVIPSDFWAELKAANILPEEAPTE